MKTPIPLFHGVVDDEGRLHLHARQAFDAYVRRFREQPVVVTVKKATQPKSRSQLGYWWGVVIPVLAEAFGYAQHEHEAVHDEVLRVLRGLKPEPNPLKVRVSMSEMTLDEVSLLITDCRLWALDHGVVIPDAEKVESVV